MYFDIGSLSLLLLFFFTLYQQSLWFPLCVHSTWWSDALMLLSLLHFPFFLLQFKSIHCHSFEVFARFIFVELFVVNACTKYFVCVLVCRHCHRLIFTTTQLKHRVHCYSFSIHLIFCFVLFFSLLSLFPMKIAHAMPIH